MSKADDTTILVTAEVAILIAEAVTTGGFTTPSDAIREAILVRKARQDELLGFTMEELRRLGDQGESSGPGRLSLDTIQREALRRAGVSITQA